MHKHNMENQWSTINFHVVSEDSVHLQTTFEREV